MENTRLSLQVMKMINNGFDPVVQVGLIIPVHKEKQGMFFLPLEIKSILLNYALELVVQLSKG